ncbi:nuclear RNA export factor 3-like [Echinops telfairi]|uniref:Nuclear RNA export factor 3-like n=1 Tax=Echinops telfairi TaxID=9371 RepID=A0AC55D4A1_ECHTE|nr:nuclear RNA export factor 3-like [Echinops telfairi]
MEDKHKVDDSLQSARSGCIPRRRVPTCSEEASPGVDQLPLQGQGDHVARRHALIRSGVRYTPYHSPSSKEGDTYQTGDLTQGNVERERKDPEAGMEGNWQDGSTQSFSSITSPPFDIASAVPEAVQKELESRNTEMFEGMPTPEVTKMKRDEGCQGAHDLPQEVHSDSEGVMHHATEMGLNIRKGTAFSLQIQENMPKSNTRCYKMVGMPNRGQKDPNIQRRDLLENQAEGQIDEVKGLEPEEMCAGRKPLFIISPDKPSNMSSDLLDSVPKLISLDDQELPSPVFSGIGNDMKLAACKGSVFESEALKDLVWMFLNQYYIIYDDGDRVSLLSAYHNNACFSLTTLFDPGGHPIVRLANYSTENRILKELKEIGPCVHVLKQTKKEVVDFLCVLPRTEHDLSSFVVDTCIQRRRMIFFSVRGKFKEVDSMCERPVCAFKRNFLLRIDSDSSMFIINDQMTVTEVSPKEPQSAPVPTASSSFVPTTSQEQQDVQQATSTGSATD